MGERRHLPRIDRAPQGEGKEVREDGGEHGAVNGAVSETKRWRELGLQMAQEEVAKEEVVLC